MKDNEGWRNIQESTIKLVEVVWACIEKRIRIRRQESDGDQSAGGKNDRWLDNIKNDLSERELSA